MTDRLIRLMRIITLVQAKPGILARELAERCGNSERTIYRDMDALSAMHIPITHLGHGKGYAFIGNFALYPLDWSDEEAMAFAQLRNLMDDIKPLLPSGFESAYEKVMAAEYKHRADKEEKMEIVGREAGTAWMERGSMQPEHPAFLIEVFVAMLKQKSIQVDYSENSHEEKGIAIDPYYLIPLENRFYLIGYCHRFGVMRTFHTNGLSNVKPLKYGFSKDNFDLQAFMKHKWELDKDSLQVEFKIKFSEWSMERIRKEGMLMKPARMDRENRFFQFKVSVDQEITFVRWILEFGEEAELVEPSYYREVMRHQLEKGLSLYK
ncbi:MULTISPECIES: helix-turn-helix transcriptional regulator [unclassified Paenibacillus]|uniref:helix-turn-helix transcriptional regulator n=1 Tax=unclassified Paenibacillus TaxID=185978 RepID=UPI00367DCEE7